MSTQPASAAAGGAANSRLARLAEAGVAIWLDELSRERLRSGTLAEMVRTQYVVGVTSNPTIFDKAISGSEAYDTQLRELAGSGADVDTAVWDLITSDIRSACDVLRPEFDRTDGVDGRISVEVDPRLAHDTERTVAQAKQLWSTIDRSNLFIKIPATPEGLPAITETLASGISVNVTLIFSVQRYREVMEAYLTGMERAQQAGHDLAHLGSVASFFVSRVDAEVDDRLHRLGADEQLFGTAALANARLAYAAYEEVLSGDRWERLARAGAHPQRPLWASTGTKNPDYSDTLYVTELVTEDVVNTMPEGTLQAFADHGDVHGDRVSGRGEHAKEVFAALGRAGVDLDDVYAVLEREGVEKFAASWESLLATVGDQLQRSSSSQER